MTARFLILALIVTLALPVTALRPPDNANQASWSPAAVAAKSKRHRRTNKRPRQITITRTVRQPVTRTLTSTRPLTIPGGAPGTDEGPATPYPSVIEVSGFSNGVITDVNLRIDHFTHAEPVDVDVILTSSDGRQALVMSDVGGATDVANVDLTLDDEAAASLPSSQLTSGTFRPTNEQVHADDMAAPAPAPDGHVALSAFDGADPNGSWRLWVDDNQGLNVGSIGGWSLEITAEADVQIQERAPSGQDAGHRGRHGKGGKRSK